MFIYRYVTSVLVVDKIVHEYERLYINFLLTVVPILIQDYVAASQGN
jgi:hypothetical protein